MLGVVIGVSSVVALAGVGEGAAHGLTTQLEGLGANMLTVNPGSTTAGLTRQAAGSAQTLTLDDAAALRGLTGVAAVEPEIAMQGHVVAGSENVTTSVIGTSEEFLEVRAYTMARGSFFNAASDEEALRFAILGADTADALQLGSNVIGSTISIEHLPFKVVGILDRKGSAGPLSNDDLVLIPTATMQHYFNSTQRVRSIGLSVATSAQIPIVKSWITVVLQQRHGIPPKGVADFTIADQAQLLGTATAIASLLTVLLTGIAAISLMVGGIGIMNIMLVSVRERTREIGLRKAVGARGRDILAQFLVEALTLSVLGGVVGIVAGIVVSAAIALFVGWNFFFSPWTAVVALGFSVLVGCVFGMWPARQAAKIDPILALRYE